MLKGHLFSTKMGGHGRKNKSKQANSTPKTRLQKQQKFNFKTSLATANNTVKNSTSRNSNSSAAQNATASTTELMQQQHPTSDIRALLDEAVATKHRIVVNSTQLISSDSINSEHSDLSDSNNSSSAPSPIPIPHKVDNSELSKSGTATQHNNCKDNAPSAHCLTAITQLQKDVSEIKASLALHFSSITNITKYVSNIITDVTQIEIKIALQQQQHDAMNEQLQKALQDSNTALQKSNTLEAKWEEVFSEDVNLRSMAKSLSAAEAEAEDNKVTMASIRDAMASIRK